MRADMEPSTTTKSLLPLVLTPVTLHTLGPLGCASPQRALCSTELTATKTACRGCHAMVCGINAALPYYVHGISMV